jgi:hypothetical protein
VRESVRCEGRGGVRGWSVLYTLSSGKRLVEMRPHALYLSEFQL